MHPVEAELRELRDQLAREHTLLEPIAHLRQDALAHELPHGVTNRPLLVVEQRVEGEEVERVERGGLRVGYSHGGILRPRWGQIPQGSVPALRGRAQGRDSRLRQLSLEDQPASPKNQRALVHQTRRAW